LTKPLPWWIADCQWNSHWSNDEQQAAMRGWLIAMPTSFLATYLPTLLVLNALNLDHSIGALLGLAICAYPTFYLAGRTSEWLWPELSQHAAENAKRRQSSPRP
jgi:hypothetical protein